ncbi:MAG TPA: DUF1501 domain-containing protein [Chitinophagaceae bacterium]|nr:DUF1501 domain-containing protein [Chitinophagaceae bacterium]
MKRRDFLFNTIPAAALLPEVIDGYSVKAFNMESPLVQALMRGDTLTDHVLVIVQLSGGNDGLNMVIPVADYSNYFNARSNVAIPQNRVLSIAGVNGTGLHPAMTGLQSLFSEGKAKVIQAVGYPQPNFSHFRATDIWMSASNSTQEVYSGWAGRYLNYEYPNFPVNYPNADMTDPLAIQIGSTTSLTTQGPIVNMGMSITNPTTFYNLITGVTDPAPNTPAGKELSYIRTVNQQTQKYATVIRNAANLVPTQGAYPANNTLGDQLRIVARLVKGGLKTRVYMVSFGGFDTHSVQVNSADTTTGAHATLLQRVSDAIRAFQEDLRGLGVEQRVVGMTYSEFGRRIKSNSSTGTDHGAAAPMFLFGTSVESGMLGVNPTIPVNANVNDNVPMQYDFRSVYSTLLEKWFCLDRTIVDSLFPPGINAQLQNLPLIKPGLCTGVAPPPPPPTGKPLPPDLMIQNRPNPFWHDTEILFRTAGGHTFIQVMDTMGRVIATLVDADYQPGEYKITFKAEHLPTGVYYARFQNGVTQHVRAMMKVRQ